VSPVEELFSVGVALAGLAGFALALALVEQVVLETNMANVKRGSPVYESGHVSDLDDVHSSLLHTQFTAAAR
jgi:hypothetical protein